jgi:hypothetical protein
LQFYAVISLYPWGGLLLISGLPFVKRSYGMNNESSNNETQKGADRKAASNRKNSRLSTGPKSQSGKAKSSQNALKHGFYAKSVLLPGEDPAAYEAFRDALWSDLDPLNALEALWAKEITDTSWRLQRLGLIEAEVFTRRSVSFSGDNCGIGFAFVNDSQGLSTLTKLSQYESTFTRRLHRAMEQFRLLREKGLVGSASPQDDPVMGQESAAESCNAQTQSENNTIANKEIDVQEPNQDSGHCGASTG